jgi:hypothetical protein
MRCRRSLSGYGRGRSNTACTTLKIAVVPAVPSESESTTASVNPGFRWRPRPADSQIADRIRDHASAALVAHILLQRFEIADAQRRLSARVCRREAGRELPLHLEIHVIG